MRMVGVIVQCEQKLVIEHKDVLGERSRGMPDCSWLCASRHRKNDVDRLRPLSLAVAWRLEAPFPEDLFDLLEALDLLAALVLRLQLAVPSDVGQMRQTVRPALSAARYLDQDLRRLLGDPTELACVGADRVRL